MERVREHVEIEAPVDKVWAAVHRDIASVPRWSKNLVKTEIVGGGSVGAGTDLLYVARLPGGVKHDLHLHIERYEEHVRCSGTVEGGVMSGRWSWRYRSSGTTTIVVYETTVQLRGMLRLPGACCVTRSWLTCVAIWMP